MSIYYICHSFNEQFFVVFSTFINFINSFRFDTALMFCFIYILNNTSEIYARILKAHSHSMSGGTI